MKLKLDFVTNSSSASFTILKENLTEIQIFLIKNHTEVVNRYEDRDLENLNPENWDNKDWWKIEETETEIKGNTMMDNFDMKWFLREIGVKDEHIKYERP
jgi:hypothetical protein